MITGANTATRKTPSHPAHAKAGRAFEDQLVAEAGPGSAIAEANAGRKSTAWGRIEMAIAVARADAILDQRPGQACESMMPEHTKNAVCQSRSPVMLERLAQIKPQEGEIADQSGHGPAELPPAPVNQHNSQEYDAARSRKHRMAWSDPSRRSCPASRRGRSFPESCRPGCRGTGEFLDPMTWRGRRRCPRRGSRARSGSGEAQAARKPPDVDPQTN